MDLQLSLAEEKDLPAIAALMNAAFRGPTTQRAWTVEGDYITGERTSVSLLAEELAAGTRTLLLKNETGVLSGCVSLRPLSPRRWYLGALTVDPSLQNAGLGRRLLLAAEEYAYREGAREIEMTVVNLRDALIAWYERRGYQKTGQHEPFPYGDPRFGIPLRDDLNFVVLEKHLSPPQPDQLTRSGTGL
jgi:ribosomal protein S18 acetylase RimI-like enzyme